MKILRTKTYELLIENVVRSEMDARFYQAKYSSSIQTLKDIIEIADRIIYTNQKELLLNLEHQGWI